MLILGTCWSLRHAEQLLFSCLCSKVSICNYVTCHMSHFACQMSYVKCLCWSLGHSEKLLFSCVSSKVSICNYVKCHMSHVACHMSHVACHMSHVKCLCWSLGHVDPWDMLNNFCFHVYAQKWVFVIMSYVTFCMSHVVYVKCLCWSLGHAEQLLFSCVSSKVSICNYVTCHMSHFACHMSDVICQMLMLILGTCWTTFVFMCKLKSEYL